MSQSSAEPSDAPFDPVPLLATELNLAPARVSAVVKLLAESSTVPFIARYRKEATGGLDEVQIRSIEERRTYLIELDARRKSIISEIRSQGKLTPELEKQLAGAMAKAELEDLYLPFKPKRRTRATIAKERGLEPLANLIWAQGRDGSPATSAHGFVNAEKDVADVAAALAGARDICAERIAEDPEVRKHTREAYVREGSIRVSKTKDFEDKTTKFDSYAAFEEPIAKIPSHRYLAIRRGETEGVLRAGLTVDESNIVPFVQRQVKLDPASPWAGELKSAIQDGIDRLLLHSVQVDVRVELKMQADKGAIEVFAQNLRELLLSAPFGTKTVLGIDPGQRTGCKCAVVDETGKLLAHETIYLVQGESALERAKEQLRALCNKYPIVAVAVGNGTHGRETESFVRDLLKEEGLRAAKAPLCVSVSEAGASIYSASDIAREEFPDLDLTVRGAVSIARRLQDPLAELVKVDPKSIGVGQYQHDVFQAFLVKKLDEVVESCVNSVGVEVNLASAPLLSRVAGIGPTLAKKIVAYRNEKGAFRSRNKLLEVPGFGPRTFEQAAGFLRVRGGEHPLDESAVHPERYALVEKMAADLGVPVVSLVGNRELLERLDPTRYQAGDVGSFTLSDILSELKKPGRDPRASFEPPKFRDDVRTLQDLKPEMQLEGVVTNVTAFGAFVDIGVHQDGLVHISQLSDRFIKDPNEVVKVGDKLNVRVLEVDLARKRIALSAKRGSDAQVGGASGARPEATAGGAPPGQNRDRRPPNPGRPERGKPAAKAEGFSNNPFAAHFRK
jgi:uncharacterized protein